MGIEVGAIILALGLLMTVAYRGLPVLVFAPLCALLASAFSNMPLLPSYTELFMSGVAGFVRAFFVPRSGHSQTALARGDRAGGLHVHDARWMRCREPLRSRTSSRPDSSGPTPTRLRWSVSWGPL